MKNEYITVQEASEIFKIKIDDFLKEIEGRFSQHVSNEFIRAYIMREFKNDYSPRPYRHPENIAYHCAVALFESIIEHGCGFPCNGHHVAQQFAAHFKDVKFDKP